MAQRIVLVTGATGCVGSHVVEALAAPGDKVRALVRDLRGPFPWAPSLNVEVFQGDLTQPEALRAAGTGVDQVVHCAAKVGDWGPLEEYREANVEGLRHLLEASNGPSLKRFVHVSSLGTYEARHHHGTDETTPLPVAHMDGYTQSKAEADRLALEYHHKQGMPVVVLRPGFIYGPRDRTVLPKLVENLRQKKVKYLGSGRQAMNCIYVGNLVDAVLLALESPKAVGEAFNITDGEYVSKKRFIEKVANGFSVPKPGWFKVPLWLAMPLAKWMESSARKNGAKEPPLLTGARVKFLGLNLDFSIEKAKKILGYAPKTSFDQGMESTIASYLVPTTSPK